jgi:hypothetical protein
MTLHVPYQCEVNNPRGCLWPYYCILRSALWVSTRVVHLMFNSMSTANYVHAIWLSLVTPGASQSSSRHFQGDLEGIRSGDMYLRSQLIWGPLKHLKVEVTVTCAPGIARGSMYMYGMYDHDQVQKRKRGDKRRFRPDLELRHQKHLCFWSLL